MRTIKEAFEYDQTYLQHEAALVAACTNNNLEAARKALDTAEEFRSNLRDEFNQSPIYIAAKNNNFELLKDLLAQEKFDINAPSASGYTPLMQAINNNNNKAVQSLLQHGAKANDVARFKRKELSEAEQAKYSHRDIKFPIKDTPLCMAVEQENPKIVAQLLAAGANPNEAKRDGETALLIAAEKGNQKIVAQLLAAGADPTQKLNRYGDTAFSMAADAGHYEVVALLCQAKHCSQEQLQLQKNLALYKTIKNDSLENYTQEELGVIKALLENGANPDARVTDDYKTANDLKNEKKDPSLNHIFLALNSRANDPAPNAATRKTAVDEESKEYKGTDTWSDDEVDKEQQVQNLLDAAESGDLNQVRTLLKQGVEVNSTDDEGYTALRQAADNGHLDIVKALVSAGANCNQADEYGDTALIRAAYQGHTDVVQCLLNAGASLESKNEFDNTALIVAAWKGHTEVVKALVGAGANVDAKNEYGATALLAAAQNGHTDVVDYLAQHDANPEAANSEGYTALMLAAEKGHTKAISHMLNNTNMLNINAKNHEGETALMLAAKHNNHETVLNLCDNHADINITSKSGSKALAFAQEQSACELILKEQHKASSEVSTATPNLLRPKQLQEQHKASTAETTPSKPSQLNAANNAEAETKRPRSSSSPARLFARETTPEARQQKMAGVPTPAQETPRP